MIKKYFALTVVAATVAMAGCSSDDNDDTPTNPTDPAFTATPGVGGSSFDTIALSDQHTTLQAAIEAAGLADTLDNPASAFTIFAPTDAAFTALDNDGDDATPTTAELLADVPALTRVLQYHVVSGTVNAEAVTALITNATTEAPATADTLLVDGDTTQVLTFANSDSAPTGVSVNTIDIDAVDQTPADVTETQGLVHVISTVIIPPAAPVNPEPPVEPPVDPGPTPGAGEVQAALEAAGTFSGFITAFNNSFGLTKLDAETDADPWTVFAPTDAALAGAALNVTDHIATGSKLSPADLLAAGTFTTFNGTSHAVGGTEAALTVGGFAVSVVGEGASITYQIDGVLAP